MGIGSHRLKYVELTGLNNITTLNIYVGPCMSINLSEVVDIDLYPLLLLPPI